MRRKSLVRFVMGLCLVHLSLALSLAAAPEPQAAARYGRHVETLASDEFAGRSAGTSGAALARKYLVEQFRLAGLKPAFGEDYTQPFELTLGSEAKVQQLEATGPEGKAAALQAGRDFSAPGISASKVFSGKAVFVGYAVTNKSQKYDNFAGAARNALKGKVAVAFRYEPQNPAGQSKWNTQAGQWSRYAGLSSKAALAARYGASALLVVNPPAHAKGPLLTARTTGSRRGSLPVLHVATGAFKKLLARANLDADDELARLQKLADGTGKVLGEIPGLSLSGRVELKPVKGKTHNIAAALPGKGKLAGDVVIVGAHWDHIGAGGRGGRPGGTGGYYPGANDNASGTAGVVTLAARFAARAKTAAAESRRTIVFACFGAEERGLLGSGYMAGHLQEMDLDVSRVAAMVNMDMIGRMTDDALKVWGVDSGKGWDAIVRKAGEGSKLKMALSGPGLGPSDHASFYRAKIPVVCFSTGMYPDMHRKSDTADKINSAGAVRILAVVDNLVQTLATRTDRIAYLAPKPRQSGRRVLLGVQIEPAPDGGVRLTSVQRGMPAATAGLRVGDILTHGQGKPIGGVTGLRAILAKAKPGNSAKFTVRRGKETLQVTVSFPRR